MKIRALFGLSVLSSYFAWGIATALYFWPALHMMPIRTALMALIAPHMFRFIGLSFLVPGVVSETLPQGFARPAAWGDLVAAFLAMAATLGFAANAPWAIAAVWVFNIWGAIDLVNANIQGLSRLPADGPTALGAAFYIPTLIVPALLISHGLIFWLLLQPIAH